MKIVKKPKWDKQDPSRLQVLHSPDGPSKNAAITDPLRAGHRPVGTIGGVEIEIKLTNIISATEAEGVIIRIGPPYLNRENLEDLCLDDIVFIRRRDMSSIDVEIS